jgi:outer membrane protein insertion porin family
MIRNNAMNINSIISVMALGALCALLVLSAPSFGADKADIMDQGQDKLPVKVGKIETVGLLSITEAEFLYLMDIKEGDPLDLSRLRAGIKRAFLKGIFEDIRVESTSGNAIRITVEEKPVVSSVGIEGNKNISTRLLKKSLSVTKGKRYNPAAIEKTVTDLNEILRKKGFPDGRVVAEVKKKGANKVDLVFMVQEGAGLVIKDIKISGDREVISGFLNVGVGDIYDLTEIEASDEKIRAYMKKRGVIGSRLTHSFKKGVLEINLSKGSDLEIEFEGNSHIGSDTLKKEAPFFELESFSYDLLEETVRRIVAVYHKEGFSDIQIAPVVSESGEDLEVKFYVNEGTRYKVEKIEFQGVTLPADKLKNIIRLQVNEDYNPDYLGQDGETILEFYRSLGYLRAEVLEPVVDTKEDRVSIVFRFAEGDQVKLKSVDTAGNKAIKADAILKAIPLKKGNPYNEVDILNSNIGIIDLYHKAGFLDASVSVKRKIDGKDSVVTFDIREGERSYFGKTVVIGNEDTRREVITRSLVHKEEEPFNSSLLLSERRKLYRTGIFSGVDIQPSDRLGRNRDALYKLEEGDAGAVEFGAGYAEYEKFRGFFDASYKNLFGMNREIAFRTELSTLTRRFILSYYEPWFLDEKLAFKAQLMKEYKKETNIDTHDVRYRSDRYVALAGVERKLTDKIKVDAYYELTHVNTYDVSADTVLTKEDTGTLLISAIKAGLIYDARDNAFDPRHGILAGVTGKLASSYFLSETNFVKAQMYLNGYQELFRGLVLAASARGGYAYSMDNNHTIPLVERFFLGGRTTVRGYDQDMLGPKGVNKDPTGGNIFLMGNTELRIDVWKGFGLVLFVDTGNVWQNMDDFSITSLKFTTGAGLRYNTPVGPIRVDYGFKLSRQAGENPGAVHFSVGHAF